VHDRPRGSDELIFLSVLALLVAGVSAQLW
jgi:hypothetical protein